MLWSKRTMPLLIQVSTLTKAVEEEDGRESIEKCEITL